MTLEEIYEGTTLNPVTGCRNWGGKRYIEPIFGKRKVRDMVWELAYGDVPTDYHPVASCNNAFCVAEEHLTLEPIPVREFTVADRVVEIPSLRRKVRHLEPWEAGVIRNRLEQGDSKALLAQEFGVTWQTIHNVARGAVHADVPPPGAPG